MRDKILAFLREKGPSFPAEVASYVGGNSFLIKAYLSELVSENKIISAKMGLKEGLIYFLPGQQQIAELKVNEIINIKRTPSMYSKQDTNKNISPELLEKQRKFSQIAEESLKKEMRDKANFQKLKEIEQRRRNEPLIQGEKTRTEVFRKEVPTSSFEMDTATLPKIEEKGNFNDKAMNFISRNDIKIIEEIESKKGELNLILEVPTPIGNFPFFCKIKNKKKVNDSDLSLVHSIASSKNMGALLITGGSLSKSADEFLEKTKNLFIKII